MESFRDDVAAYGARVGERLAYLRADREARAILAAEGHDEQPFDAGTLAEVLARPAEPAARVDGLIGWEASTLLVAQRKVGKTTLVLNLARKGTRGLIRVKVTDLDAAFRPVRAGDSR